jgi:hypothetical protein
MELRKAVLKVQRSIETPFMRIGLNTEEKAIVRAFSRTTSVVSKSSDTFSRAASGTKDAGQASQAPLPDLLSTRWALLQEEEVPPEIGDVFFAADLQRPQRSYPTCITPFTGPPYASPVEFVDDQDGVIQAS